jgi:MoaA/NifB/PqqE/SkfB family radical SAM enzyme
VNARQWIDASIRGVKLLVLRRQLPCFAGLVLTDGCNLDCFYCQSKNLGESHFTFRQACTTIEDAYRRGHRFLYVTGGEPTLWHDGPHGLGDVVAAARDTGFFSVFVYTNGTRPLDIRHCVYVITVDGPQRVHDHIRGGTWERIMSNVRSSGHRAVFASITLCQENVAHLVQFVQQITALGLFRGIWFNLLTHRPEFLSRHGLTDTQRTAALDNLWRLKCLGYPIGLSAAAYRAMRNDDWKRPIRQIEVITSRRVFPCCRDVEHPEVCAHCGYSGCAEVAQVLAGRPSAIIQAMRLTRLSSGDGM